MSMPNKGLMAVLLALFWIHSRAVRADDPSRPSDPRVARAMKEWKQGDQEIRLEALRRLGRLGHRSRPAVADLISGLSDPALEIRAATADALGQIGWSEANPALIAALRDPEREVRSAAAAALARTRPDKRKAIPALAASLRADPLGYGDPAVETLAAMGEPAVPVAIELLQEANPELTSSGAALVAKLGPAATATIPSLIKALHRPERQIRDLAAEALASIGDPAIEAITLALRDRDPRVRGGAARALQLMGNRGSPAIAALIAMLADPEPPDDSRPAESDDSEEGSNSPQPRPSAYQAALVAIGRASVPALLQQLESTDHSARVRAVRTIAFLREQGKAAVPRLIALLGHPDIRVEAAWALGRIGTPARAAVPMLISALKNRDAGLRLRAAEALGRIGEHSPQQRTPLINRGVVAALASALKDPDYRVRAAAAAACSRVGPQASAASPELVASLRDPEAVVRLAALRALGRIVQHSAPAQSALLGCLRDEDRRVRLVAALAIAGSDLNSDAVIAGLLAALRDPDVEVRAAAVGRLVCTNGKGGFSLVEGTLDQAEADGTTLAASPSASASLRAALADPDRRVRAAAAYVLPIFKKKGDAADAVPLLIERLQDPATVVRVAAARSLGQFGQAARPALPALLQALADPGGFVANGFSVSTKAAQAVLAISPGDDKGVCDRLLTALADPRASVREAASETLRQLKDPVSSRLYRALADPATGPPIRRRIVEILATEEMGGSSGSGEVEPAARGPEAHAAIPALCGLAEDPDEDVCLGAIRLLEEVDPRNHPLPQSILNAVGKATVSLAQVEFSLRGAGPSDAAVLIKGLKDANEDVRTVAAYALADMALDQQLEDPKNPEDVKPRPGKVEVDESKGLQALKNQIVDALIVLLDDPDTQVRWAAAWALGTFPRDEEHRQQRALPALRAIVRDRSTRMREDAWIRVADGSLENELDQHTARNADGEKLRIAAIQAIGAFGADAVSAVPDLLAALKDDDPEVRWFAARAIGAVGPRAREAVPALIVLLQSSTRLTRTRDSSLADVMPHPPATLQAIAAKALGKIGSEARAAVPSLVKAMDDREIMVRIAAAEALGEIGPKDPAVLPALARAMTGKVDENLAEQAASALGAIGEASITFLVSALRDRDPDVRARAARALTQMGKAATGALPALERAVAADDDPDATQAIEVAIQEIRKYAGAAESSAAPESNNGIDMP